MLNIDIIRENNGFIRLDENGEYLHNIFQASIENLILSSAYCRSSKPPARLPRFLPFSTFVLSRPSFFRSSISIPDCFSFFFYFYECRPFSHPFPLSSDEERTRDFLRFLCVCMYVCVWSVLYKNILDCSAVSKESLAVRWSSAG